MTVAQRLITAGDIVTGENPTFQYKVLERDDYYATLEPHSYRGDGLYPAGTSVIGTYWEECDGSLPRFEGVEVSTLTLVE